MLGEGIQTTATVNGGGYLINGLQFVDSAGTIGSGLVNTVTLTNSASGTNDNANMVTGLNVIQSGDVTLGDGSPNTVNITGKVTDAVLGTPVSSEAALNLGNNSYTRVTVHGNVSGQDTRRGKIAGLSVQDAGSVLEGKTGTQVEVMQDTGRADEAIGLDAQNGGKLTLGARTKVTVNHNSILQDGDSSNLYSYGIQKDASSVSLGNEANIISNGYTATGVYTHEDGAVTILGDFTSVSAHADYDYNAYGVWSDNSGINILGKESVITSSETGRGNSVARSASTGGANQVGDDTQLKADNEIGFAYGVKTNQGTNNLGENINISSYSSKLSAYGMATSGTQGITTVKDSLVIQTVADGGQARGIYNEQDGITAIGNKASINVTGLASSGDGMDVSGGKVKMGDNATIQVKETSGYGISIGQETGSSTVEMGKNASITVESDDMSVGVLNDGGTMTVVENFSSQVSGVIDSYGIVIADGGVTTIGSGAGISVAGENQLDTGSIAAYTLGGSTAVGDNSTVTATVDAGTASGVNTSSGSINLGNYVSVYVSGNTAYGVVSQSQNSTVIGTDARITSVTAKDEHTGVGIYANGGGKNIEIGSRASVTAQGKDAVGVYSDNAGETNFLRSARITGNLYSLESEGDGSKIDLSAGGTKVITGNMLSADGGNINVEMDTGDSLFTGASIVQGADSETDISMSNGGLWNMTGDSTVTNFAMNSGAVVNMTANTDYQTLTVDNFSGNDGILLMKLDLETQAAD